MKFTKNHPLFQSFLNLSCRLSPENLTMDGECSRAEVNARHRRIMNEWKALEAKAGFGVNEDEVWRAELSK